ncbi:MAG: right-handed parallel beta-helix repeat-containing protein [Candidatus Thorarchaeota archaeon]|nr:right-handed parallel beta-helix repeat-containing protein [Candidatus Thorarchaeota archaeon]
MSSFIQTNKKMLTVFIILIIIGSTSVLILYGYFLTPDNNVTFAGGTLTQDTTWSGLVHVESFVAVPEGITLTILPGTTIEFRHYRGYTDDQRVGLIVGGGTVIAQGTPDAQIWFTSDADDPINGDWAGISCSFTESVFKYVIVEYSIIGIEQVHSNMTISHSIIRWVNTEGIYAETSRPIIEYNLIYGNAYHDIALEQFNPDVQIRHNIFKGGHASVHAEATNVTIAGNYFVNYTVGAISGGQFSNMTIVENKFEDIDGYMINLDPTTTNVTQDNDFGSGILESPQLDFPDSKRSDLGYTPGDPEDEYLYVYPEFDQTRRIVDRLENETEIGSALTYLNGSLWRFNVASWTKGTLQDFIEINPVTGNNTIYGNNFVINPRGLTNDGNFFWVNDVTLKKIFKFKINSSDFIEIIDSFDIPNPSEGGLSSLVCDGSYLYSLSRDTSVIYKIDMSGTLVTSINYQGAPLWGALVWTGIYFWAHSGIHITKWYANWTLAGKIYPVAWGTDALAWDGTYLWSLQRTCEVWKDGKIFQIEILNDQLLL